ncbi:MAG: hypothetical protein ACLTSJ_10115 [Alistipes communis]
MFADIHFIDFLRANPALAVFVTLALGFLVGKLRWRSFSLGTVTSVLLVGVVVGQLKIEIPEPAKILFFLLFLFSVGYAVGPQFFRGLKRDGLPQVGFAVVVCLLCLGSTWLCATLMGYDVAQAAGLLAGSQTMSAVLGVATDTIRQLPDGQAIDLDAMPVCYAVTYIFGTAGSAWILERSARVCWAGWRRYTRRRSTSNRSWATTSVSRRASILRRVPSSSAPTRPKTTGSGSGTPSPNSNATCSRRRN